VRERFNMHVCVCASLIAHFSQSLFLGFWVFFILEWMTVMLIVL